MRKYSLRKSARIIFLSFTNEYEFRLIIIIIAL